MGGTHRFVAPRCTPLAVNVSSLVSVPRPLPLPRGYSACCSASRVLARNGFCVLLARGLALCVLYPSHSSRGISGCVLCPPVPVCGVGCGLSPVYLPGRVGIRVSRYNVPNFQLRAGSGFCGPLGPCGDLRALRAPLRALYCFIWWLLCWLSLLGCGYRWGAGEVPSRYQAWRRDGGSVTQLVSSLIQQIHIFNNCDQNVPKYFSQHVWEWEVLPIGQLAPRAVRGAQGLWLYLE